MTLLEIEAQISRAKVCMENATDFQDKRYWCRRFLELVQQRNEIRGQESE